MDHIDVDDMVSRAINGQSAPSACAAGLLKIFDKAGYALSQYYKSMEENVPFEDVILQVAGLLKEAGFRVTRNDVDLSNSFSLRLDVLDHIHEKLGITTDPSKECVAPSVHLMLGSDLPVLCFDEKMDSCLPKGWEGRLLPILAEDDKDRFIDFMVNEKEVDSSIYSKVLQHCLYEQAKKCALVMIKWELPGFANPVDCGSTTLFNAVGHLCDPEVIRILLQNCKGSYLANQTVLHYLPIHIVLAEIMAAEHLSKWSIGESVIKLLILVCHPKTKPRVECARLIAEYTNDANKVALGLLQRGDIRQLAALLLVAHHKVFEPLSTGETIMDHTDFNDMILPSINGQFAASASAAGLLRIFDKAGDALSQFYKQMKEDVRGEDVVVEVAYLIKKAGFLIEPNDVDVASSLSLRPDMMDRIHTRIGITGVDVRKVSQMSKNCVFPSVRSFMATPFGSDQGFRTVPGFRTLPMQQYSTAALSHKIGRGKQCWSSPSSRAVASVAMKLKRAMRFL